jgi:hypothetical protein
MYTLIVMKETLIKILIPEGEEAITEQMKCSSQFCQLEIYPIVDKSPM